MIRFKIYLGLFAALLFVGLPALPILVLKILFRLILSPLYYPRYVAIVRRERTRLAMNHGHECALAYDRLHSLTYRQFIRRAV